MPECRTNVVSGSRTWRHPPARGSAAGLPPRSQRRRPVPRELDPGRCRDERRRVPLRENGRDRSRLQSAHAPSFPGPGSGPAVVQRAFPNPSRERDAGSPAFSDVDLRICQVPPGVPRGSCAAPSGAAGRPRTRSSPSSSGAPGLGPGAPKRTMRPHRARLVVAGGRGLGGGASSGAASRTAARAGRPPGHPSRDRLPTASRPVRTRLPRRRGTAGLKS